MSEQPTREAFCDALRRRVGPQRYATWFEGGVAIAIRRPDEDQPTEARLTAPSAFELGLLRKQFHADLDAVVGEALGEGSRVTYSVGKAQAAPADPAQAPQPNAPPLHAPQPVAAQPPAATEPERPAPAKPAPTPPRPPAQQPYGWVTGEGNAAATRLSARLVTGEPGPSPVLLWGPSGVGKSHLLKVVADGYRARKRRVLAITAEQFLRGFVDAARGGGFPGFRQKHQGVDLLVVDDVQQLVGKTRTVEEFRQTIDALIESGAQIVLAADRGPGELRGLGPEIASRLAGGLSVEIAMPDIDMRERLAQQAAERIGLRLPTAAARALACRLIGGGREIRGAVNRMALLHDTFGSALDERLASQVADDTNRLSTPPVRIGDIERAVCDVFGVDARTLRSDKRTKAVTEPRMLAMFLSRKMTSCPWSEIGDHFGRRSHSTVIAAHRRVEQLLASSEPVRLKTGDLGETIRRVEAALRSA